MQVLCSTDVTRNIVHQQKDITNPYPTRQEKGCWINFRYRAMWVTRILDNGYDQ
jgi:hypothetical protein